MNLIDGLSLGVNVQRVNVFSSLSVLILLSLTTVYLTEQTSKLGTGRGIGPTYGDAIERVGIRFVDISNVLSDENQIQQIVVRMNGRLSAAGLEPSITDDTLRADLEWIQDRFGRAVRPTGLLVHHALERGENILLEGAQGALLDISQGTYPFVTSSVTSRSFQCHTWGRNSPRAC